AAAAHPAAKVDVFPAAEALRIGQAHYAAGRIEEAIAALRRGLEAPDAGNDVATMSELHAKLGNAYMLRGHLDLAGGSYKAPIKVSPQLAGCWCNLGTVHLKSGRARTRSRFTSRR